MESGNVRTIGDVFDAQLTVPLLLLLLTLQECLHKTLYTTLSAVLDIQPFSLHGVK